MRIRGWIILIVGVLFTILTVVRSRQDHYRIFDVGTCVALLTTGWAMIKYGSGIEQSKQLSPAAVTSTPAAPQIDPNPTIERPLTPAVARILTQRNDRSRPWLYVSVASFVVFTGLGVFTLTDQSSGMLGLMEFGGAGVASGLIFFLMWRLARRPVQRDLSGSKYLRTIGPVEVVQTTFGGPMLCLSHRAFFIHDQSEIASLGKLKFGQVDYTPHAHIILAAWNESGRLVYSLPGYDAAFEAP